MQNIVLISIPETTIRSIVQQAVRNALSEYITSQEEDQSKIVDLSGLLKARPFIGSRSTIYKKVSKGLIPHSKEGKKLYFDLNEIDKHLMSNKIKTLSQVNQEAQDYLKKNRR